MYKLLFEENVSNMTVTLVMLKGGHPRTNKNVLLYKHGHIQYIQILANRSSGYTHK